jgi:hypothetical protein
LTETGETNLQALTDNGFEFPWTADFHTSSPVVFEHLIVTDTQILLLSKGGSSSGLALTGETATSTGGSSGASEDQLVFQDVKIKEGESIAGFPAIMRIDRATGKLQVPLPSDHDEQQARIEELYGLVGSLPTSKYVADGAGNFYFTDYYGVRKVNSSTGEITNVFKGEELKGLQGMADGSFVVHTNSEEYVRVKGTSKTKYGYDDQHQWMEVLPDGKMYFGFKDKTIKRYTASGTKEHVYDPAGTETSDGPAPSVGSGDGPAPFALTSTTSKFLKIVTSSEKAWAVHKDHVMQVYPAVGEEEVATVEAATSYEGKLVLVGDGRVTVDGEEVGTYAGTANSISLKGSILMVAGDDVTEVNLDTKEVKDLNLGKVSAIESL